jgi:hypothetical protein
MVAYSGSDDLDNLGANNNVQRRVITLQTIPPRRPRRRKWNLTRIIASASRRPLRDERCRASRRV